MGLCASAPTKSRYVSPFDVRVTTALQAYKARVDAANLPRSERVGSFNHVLLRSARIRKALDHVKSVFKLHDVDSSDSIEYAELTEALKALGSEVSPGDAEKVFHQADMYDNNKLSLKEFIVCLLLGYVLGYLKLGDGSNNEASKEEGGGNNEASKEEGGDDDGFQGHAKELRWAFNNIIGAYLLFDVDASGDLSRDEVMAQLQAKTGVFADAAAQSLMTAERWAELDWDQDGQISFREFIWAFQSWISVDGGANNN